MNELKKCPFCGGKAELDFAHKNFTFTDDSGKPRDIGFFYTVKCQDEICGCRIGIYEDPEMAVAAWNRRSDKQEREKGYWKPITMSETTGWDLSLTGGYDEILEYRCSKCGEATYIDEFGDFVLSDSCPHCGADLRGNPNERSD